MGTFGLCTVDDNLTFCFLGEKFAAWYNMELLVVFQKKVAPDFFL
jgi:hypothetical protein